MSLSPAATLNAGCAATTALMPDISIHTASTGTTGANEVSGGSYTRQTAGWGSPSAGVASNGSTLSFAIPASTTCAYTGGWSLSSGGTFGKGIPMTSSVTFGAGGGTLTFAAAALTMTQSDSQT